VDPAKIPDWRLAKAAEIGADGVMPDGRPVRAGEIMLLVTQTDASPEGPVTFVTPGAPALALNVAVQSGRAAARLRAAVSWQIEPKRRERFLTGDGIGGLFDYFEQAMISATFACQALEAFSNQLIADMVTGTYPYQRGNKVQDLKGEELERAASTEDKFGSILPQLCKVKSPKGTAVWGRFKRLKGVRDSATHLKSYDHYRRGAPDRDSLYHRLLNADAREYPRAAILLMRHFSGAHGLRWLDESERRLNAPDV
jgi:hypothetical protein